MKSLPAIFALTLLAGVSASAKVELPAIISDHMVLEKSPATHVWGTADPDEEVSITLDGQKVKTSADSKGQWLASLNLDQNQPAGRSIRALRRGLRRPRHFHRGLG